MIKTTIFTKYDVAKDVKVSKLADGRYRGRLQISYDTITRKYQYKSFYGPNKTDVKHKIVEFIESQIALDSGYLLSLFPSGEYLR